MACKARREGDEKPNWRRRHGRLRESKRQRMKNFYHGKEKSRETFMHA